MLAVWLPTPNRRKPSRSITGGCADFPAIGRLELRLREWRSSIPLAWPSDVCLVHRFDFESPTMPQAHRRTGYLWPVSDERTASTALLASARARAATGP